MIESTSLYLANKLKNINPEQTPSVNVMRYSIKFLLLNLITICLIVITGILLADLKEVLICTLGFSLLRYFAGGYHLKNAVACTVVSTLAVHIFVLAAHLIQNYDYINLFLQVFSAILMMVFAPSGIEKQTNFKKENYKWLKLTSIVIILLNILVFQSVLLASAFFFEGLTLIKFGKGGEKK